MDNQDFEISGEMLDQEGDQFALPSLEPGPQGKATAGAYWPRDPANAPDTWHLPAEYDAQRFTLTADLLRRCIAVNAFVFPAPPHGKLIVALRGCALGGGTDKVEAVTQVELTSLRPDHETYRCLVGSVDLRTDQIWLYEGSTVPRRTSMAAYRAGRSLCNLLPTGCYRYCCGTHYSKRNGAVHHVLRQGHGTEPAHASTVTVLRTKNDLVYGTRDIWDKTKPSDNIHPAFITGSFSSQGCLTVKGSQAFDDKAAKGTGLWARFRASAGLGPASKGTRYDVVLVTGHELASFANVLDPSGLVCLRHGSEGAAVGHLQRQIGASPDDVFGPQTKHRLAIAQSTALGWATGTWTPAMATEMGMEF